jgi:hypothetical protein
MQPSHIPLTLDQPAAYQIKVQGRLKEAWSDWLEGLIIQVESLESGGAITTLSGVLADQAALFGLLSRIRDLGMPLLLVERMVDLPD